MCSAEIVLFQGVCKSIVRAISDIRVRGTLRMRTTVVLEAVRKHQAELYTAPVCLA